MRFEKKEFEVHYDPKLVKPASMLALIRKRGFKPRIQVAK